MANPSVSGTALGLTAYGQAIETAHGPLLTAGEQLSALDQRPLGSGIGGTMVAVPEALINEILKRLGANAASTVAGTATAPLTQIGGEAAMKTVQAYVGTNGTHTGIGGGIDYRGLSTDKSVPPEVAAAAKSLADNPAIAQRAEQRFSLDVLKTNFDSLKDKKGFITKESLAKAAADPSAPPEVRQAAEHFLRNPEKLHALDVSAQNSHGKGGKLDNKITLDDLDAALTHPEGFRPPNHHHGLGSLAMGTAVIRTA